MGSTFSTNKEQKRTKIKNSKQTLTSDVSPVWYHEIEISENEESGLHNRKESCTKNPGHKLFKPVEAFRIEDLPKSHRNKEIYNLIKAVADLTVRVDLKVTSPHRPEYWPNSDCPYPLHNSKEDDGKNRTGSGQISVFMMIDGVGFDAMGIRYNALGRKYQRDYKTCPCDKCLISEKPNNIWWEIIILTAAHVVFDDLEASHTTCTLFYDKENCPVTKLRKLTIDYVNIERDWCGLKYVTCDPDLGNRLYNLMEYRFELGKRIWKKYKKKSGGKRFMFIVSHPHGCTKQVSFGEWQLKEKVGEYNNEFEFAKLTYTTCTCPGSSGALVHCVGLFGANHVHSGRLESGLNYSSVGYCKR